MSKHSRHPDVYPLRVTTQRSLGINPRSLGLSPRDLEGKTNMEVAEKFREAAKTLLRLADELEFEGSE